MLNQQPKKQSTRLQTNNRTANLPTVLAKCIDTFEFLSKILSCNCVTIFVTIHFSKSSDAHLEGRKAGWSSTSALNKSNGRIISVRSKIWTFLFVAQFDGFNQCGY